MLNLKYYRLKRGLNISELSRMSGVSRPFISQIESKKHIPRVDVVCKLCKALDITPDELIKEEYYRR